MWGNTEEAKKSYEELLSYLFRMFLDKSPSDDELAELFRSNYEMRRRAALELLRRTPSVEILAMIVQDTHEADIRAVAWDRLKRSGPPAALLIELMTRLHDLADDAAAALLADPQATVPTLCQVIWHARSRAEEAAGRIMAATVNAPHGSDEAIKGLRAVVRSAPFLRKAAWERLLALAPSEDDLAALLDFNDALAGRVRAELLRRFPDNPKLRRVPYGAEKDKGLAANVADHVIGHAASTKDELLWVVRYEPTHAGAAWRKYLALGPANEELLRVMSDIAHARGRAWRVLRERGISNEHLCCLLWNLRGLNGRPIWRQLLKQSPTKTELRSLVSGTQIGLEAARMLLDREPDWDDYRAIIDRVPKMREEIFRRLSGTNVPEKHALLSWMREIKDSLRDL